MPITEIVRVLARAQSPTGALELLYDVTGAMLPDEETLGWPAFWVRQLQGSALIATHGPFDTEDEAVEFGELSLGAAEWRPG